MEGIETTDAQLLTAIEAVRADVVPDTGKANNFEAAAAHLQPRCPVARKNQSRKRPATVAEVNVSGVAAPSIGTSGVHLRWHKSHEYRELTKDQKQELYQWQKDNPEEASASRENDAPTKELKKRKKKKGNDKKPVTHRSVSKSIASGIKDALEKLSESTKKEQEVEGLIASLVDAAVEGKKHPTAVAAAVAANAQDNAKKTALRSILKNALNRK